ncbi:hypothetical protein [Shewanella donghaensis]|uniref:hypothetical protein n=1 Tax=Shewanella donghaensis TaxID=238836 RepID=UPI0011841C09|nr:hypothetical protein [Shewanella donghaensis]
MLSLSIADQYHLNIQVEIPPELSGLQLQVYFFFPAKLAENSDVMDKTNFYHNILQKQQLVKVVPISCETIDKDLMIIKQTAYATAKTNQTRYKWALSEFIAGMLEVLNSTNGDQLAYIADRIEDFARIHDDEGKLTQAKIYKLALHLLLYYYHQALLQAKHQAEKADKIWFTQQIVKVAALAERHNLRLTHDTDTGRENLLNRLHIAKRVINRPYQLTRKKLKNGEVVEQLIFGFAAALAMAFATGVAFSTQRAFGNFSTPFFISLVLSYIFKDRIKELGRNYLMEKYFSRYSQHHYRFYQSERNKLIFEAKETMYRQSPEELPEKVNQLRKLFSRADSRSFRDALVYKRRYVSHINSDENPQFKFKDKLTINLSKRLRFLPQSIRQHWSESDVNVKSIKVHTVYPINLVVAIKTDGESIYQRYKLTTSRKGIHRLEKLD